ncbi:MAG TPA: transposase [Armatimonadota bacterium]|nr:transposase [Armatimonadota bacterium]
MGRIARVVVPGLPHHITQRGNNREAIFVSPDDQRAYVNLLMDRCAKHGVSILGYCLMTNHVHVVAVPAESDSLAKGVGGTNRVYAQWFNERHGRSGHLWQDRYYSCPLDEAHAYGALVYVEQNPVRAGLVAHAWEHRWSSAHAHVTGRDPRRILDMGWFLAKWDVQHWRDALTADEDEARQEQIRKSTTSGWPAGDNEFVASLEASLGRTLRPKPRGRPRKCPST